jgi:hypothetical protein
VGFTKGLVQGLAASIGVRAAAPPAVPLTLESSALSGPVTPAPEIASPWTAPDWLQTVVWGDLFGQGKGPLTRSEAMAIPAVARSRGVVCTTLGRLPLVVVDGEGPTAQEVPGTDLGRFLAQPDPQQARFIQVLWTVDDLVFHGVSWWLVTDRYAAPSSFQRGYPRHARRILPGHVEPADGGTWKVYGKPVAAHDLIRIDGPHEGILNYAAESVRVAARLERAAAKFADNPVPAVELHQETDYVMSPQEKIDMVQSWVDARKGLNGGVAWTNRHVKAIMHGAPAEHLLTGGRNAAAVDMARVVGTPADTVDASVEHASMTYNNSEGRLRVLLDFGLAAYGAAITARLSMPDIGPRGQFAAFAYDQITAATDASLGTPAPPAPAVEPAQEDAA